MGEEAKPPARKRPTRTTGKVTVDAPRAVDPDDPVLDVLRSTTAAMRANTKATERLTTSLDMTDRTNRDTRRWRRVATGAGLLVVVALVGWGNSVRHDIEDRQNRDRAADVQRERDDEAAAKAAEASRIATCQNRNVSQRYTREANTTQDDAVIALGLPPAAVKALRDSEAQAPPDNDCDRDGVLTTADYPPEPVQPGG